jgi:hypothetical protein
MGRQAWLDDDPSVVPGKRVRPDQPRLPLVTARPIANVKNKRAVIGIMRVIFDHVRPSGRIMPVMQVIEAQSARSWGLTITSITNMCGRPQGTEWQISVFQTPTARRSVHIRFGTPTGPDTS